jgi:hypothetical protein
MKLSRRLGFFVVASRVLYKAFAAPITVQDSTSFNGLSTSLGSCEDNSLVGNVVRTLFNMIVCLQPKLVKRTILIQKQIAATGG